MTEVDSLRNTLAVALRRIDELEDRVSNHFGLDWGQSGAPNNPHPNASARNLEFGGDGIFRTTNNKAIDAASNRMAIIGELDALTYDFLFFKNGLFGGDDGDSSAYTVPYFGRIYVSDIDGSSPTIKLEVRAPATSTMQALLEILPTGIIQFSNGFGASSTTRTFGPTAATENGAIVDVGYLQLSGVVTPSQITASQNNYDPGGWNNAPPTSRNTWFRLSTDASRNITGLHAPPTGFEQGFVCILHNVGAQQIVLVDESASSTDVNRFALPENVTLAADQCAILQYDDTTNRWRCIGTSGSIAGLYTTTTVATDAIWDAKGDLAGGTGANTAAALTVGANNTLLMADSAQTTGLKWAWPILGDGSTLTISVGGAVTITTGFHAIDTNAGGASDDLDTINGGVTGQLIVLHAASTNRTVNLTQAGNIKLVSNPQVLDNNTDTVALVYNGANWLQVAFANNGV